MAHPLFSEAFDRAVHAVDRRIGWHRLPTPLGLVLLAGIRGRMRKRNLYDTAAPAGAASPARSSPSERDPRVLTTRTVDGTFNDLNCPVVGSAGTRFGRNVPLNRTWPEPEPAILTPNPRTVSRELLARREFMPATTLNLLAAAWIQFMIRDWFSHGKSETENPWQISLDEDDPWHERPMRIQRTPRDPTRRPGDDGLPPTFLNTETHWWDGSNIYGSTPEIHAMVRSGEGGKLRLSPDDLIVLEPGLLIELGSVAGWWVGMAMVHTLFVREHNAICDRLGAEYPSWSDDELFDHARLINAALMAKIHTVEWTTALLGHRTMQFAMRTNWWGVATERLHRLVGRISDSELLSGIPGSKTNHFGVPYAITEEFVAVYRMHPLIPDDYLLRSAGNDTILRECSLPEIAGFETAQVMAQVGMTNLLYSFGVAHPGVITLHNYPRTLQQFRRPDGFVVDLAAVEVLRSRELGVPRYNEFRRLVHRPAVRSFDDLTDNPVSAEELRRVYDGDLERVDLMVGLFAEPVPNGFAFSDTALRIFALMASRRLNSDRFFTTDYTPRVYTQTGLDWIDANDMSTVLLRHYPGLRPALRGVKNAFAPWTRVAA